MQDIDRLFQQLPDADARDELVLAFRPLALRIARRYADRGEDLSDLGQVAIIGLIKAIDRYDPLQGRFATFAIPTISGELKHHFRDNLWAMGVPRGLKDQMAISRRTYQELRRALGRSPTIGEVASRAGVSEHVINELRVVSNAFRPDSLDAALQGTRSAALIDRLAASDASVEEFDDIDELDAILASMTERDRRVLFLRFADEMTQAAIANQVGLSQMEVSRALQRTMRVLRARMQVADERAGRQVAVAV